MSLGTPHYMSPEQAMGEREITARSDIYALGCVLYEMLTAEPPFEGATAQAIVARVLTESPRSLRPQRKSIPPHVEAAVLTALEKLPADRFESARAFAEALGDPAYAGSPGTGTRVMASVAGAGPGTRLRRWIVPGTAAVLAAVAVGLAAGWAVWHQPAPAFPPSVLRYSMALPDTMALTDALGEQISLCPRWIGLRLWLARRPDVAVRGSARSRAGRRWTSRLRSVLLTGRALARLPQRRRRGQGAARGRRAGHHL